MSEPFLVRDSGMSLAELLVYVMLLVVITAIAGSLLITALTSQRDLTAMASATSRAQVVAASIEKGVRTASTVSAPAATAIGQRLVTRTGTFAAAGTATWQCQSWLITPAGDVYHRTSTAAIAAPTSLSPSGLSGWSLIAERVRTAPGATAAFTVNGGTVSLAIEAQAEGDGAPALVTNRISKQTLPTTSGTGPATC
ncbi:hypothetical protein M2152_000076 [Microbacteriaceae bacterium SG_E_30_P1]|uniref:Prepilin-type N-terminal cleavage/methylation domain-containing protein n=1 Tax=Antiquaquibacter oligotrophicus TaxID=2880260 RepID=A0ABT6KIX1_9MICO|nr:hypothetical protein [Antiquaquibacter oligotrophicus]MDH6179894.1 hypothetical protein [Antiquaquibacter oligotrophicus]UDF14345.1 hypothetical protein LH407_05645 [Antiquaquibacter oligotrophicus]